LHVAPARHSAVYPPAGIGGALACGGVLAQTALWRTLLLEGAAAIALVILCGPAAGGCPSRLFCRRALSAIGMWRHSGCAHGHAHWLAPAGAGRCHQIRTGSLWFWLPLVTDRRRPSLPAHRRRSGRRCLCGTGYNSRAEPWIFHPDCLAGAGRGSVIVGALLALAERNLKRLLAFSTIADMA